MNKLSTKTLKILLFIGVFFYLQYYDIKRSDYTINSDIVNNGLHI